MKNVIDQVLHNLVGPAENYWVQDLLHQKVYKSLCLCTGL
jgi:hypothetical protein